jgi:phospholipase C
MEADAPRRSSLRDIEHVVLLMQENRSFDHYFGTMAGVRGFGDKHAMKLSTGRSVTDWRRQTFGDLTSAFRFRDAVKTAPAGNKPQVP